VIRPFYFDGRHSRLLMAFAGVERVEDVIDGLKAFWLPAFTVDRLLECEGLIRDHTALSDRIEEVEQGLAHCGVLRSRQDKFVPPVVSLLFQADPTGRGIEVPLKALMQADVSAAEIAFVVSRIRKSDLFDFL
jgi:hypothetical protein